MSAISAVPGQANLNSTTMQVNDQLSEPTILKGYRISPADLVKIYKRGVLKTPNSPIPDKETMVDVNSGTMEYLKGITGLSVQSQFMWQTQSYLIYIEPTYRARGRRFGLVPVPPSQADLETWGNLLIEKIPILLDELGLRRDASIESYEVHARQEEKSTAVRTAVFMQLCLDEGLLGDSPEAKDVVRRLFSFALEFPVEQDVADEDQ
ncbi:hypothetical protein SISSUDRAFT_1053215 [Sistotremastrum suecicum HHB10207 ss-3]|uniref:Uncharacterized protein n=1 Tax=Sistotremastrum suecicum HHB10207 ss-3 TaxID=1314776 RepID=A0A165ZC96_9AGAM|nr:hypothetical protein SISSUDRAFT_1053215 [Sistotremastrum suecicum HHB10207 ss-3]